MAFPNSHSYEDVIDWEGAVPLIDITPTPSNDQLVKLLRMVLGAIAKSEDNDTQISAMQSLPYEHQMVLMRVIESVLAEGKTPEQSFQEPETSLLSEPKELEQVRRELAKQIELVSLHQDQLASAEAQVERLTEENKEMAAVVRWATLTKLPSLRESERERDTFFGQLEEWRPIVETSKRQTAQLEKYRKRLDELTELRRETQKLRTENARLTAKADANASAKNPKSSSGSEQDTFQDQIAQLSQQNAELQARCDTLESNRIKDQNELQELNQQIQSMNLTSDVPKAEGKSHNEETITSLREEITRLQNELACLSSRSEPLQDTSTPHTRESGLAAVRADITAIRNNARSKEKEAQYVFCLCLLQVYFAQTRQKVWHRKGQGFLRSIYSERVSSRHGLAY